MPGLRLTRNFLTLMSSLALCGMTIMTGCSARTPSVEPVILRPPGELMAPCVEPANPGEVLAFFSRGEYEQAAGAYVRYVLDVRDSFQICNGRLELLRQYYEDVVR